jgi:hypothetical protein
MLCFTYELHFRKVMKYIHSTAVQLESSKQATEIYIRPLSVVKSMFSFLWCSCKFYGVNMLKNVKLTLCLIKHYAMKTWGSEGIASPFLTSALVGGEWSASCPYHFTPREGVPGTHWRGDRS